MLKLRKPLALLLALLLCLSLLPAAAFAEEAGEEPSALPAEDMAPEEADPASESEESTAPGSEAGPGTEETDGDEAEPEVCTEAEPSPDEEPAETPLPDAEPAGEAEIEAESTEEAPETETFVVVNPLYADVLSEDDIAFPEDDGDVSAAATAPSFRTEAEAADYLRGAMIARQATAAFKLTGFSGGTSKLVKRLFDRATAHNGMPKAGDSLLFEYGGYRCTVSQSGSTVTVSFKLSYYTTAAQEQALDAVVVELIASLDLNGGISDYEKCLRIYEYLTDTVSYGGTDLTMYTAYAALVNHTAVCQGYSVAFYRLALEAGVDARVISSRPLDHAWNIVGLDGSYYYLDATWDIYYYYTDSYSYFLRGTVNWLQPPNNDDSHDLGDQFLDPDFAAAYPVPAEDYDLGASLNFSLTGFEAEQAEYGYDDAFQLTLRFDGEGKDTIASFGLIFRTPTGGRLSADAAAQPLGNGVYRVSAWLNNRFEPGSWKVYALDIRSADGSRCRVYNSRLYGSSAGSLFLADFQALDFLLSGTRSAANVVLEDVSSRPGDYGFDSTVTLRFRVSGETVSGVRVWLYSPPGYNNEGEYYTVSGDGSLDPGSGEILCSFSVADFSWDLEAVDTTVLDGYTCGIWELSCVEFRDLRGNSVYYGDQPAELDPSEAELVTARDLSGGNFVILPHYTVVYSSNEYPEAEKNKTVTQACSHRTLCTALPNGFTRKHYTFAGWNTAPDGSGIFIADGGTFLDLAPDTAGASATLYALWEPERFEVRFVLNGGENSPESPADYAYGVETPLPDASREGYRFAGWYAKKNLSGKRILCIAAGSTGAKTFYAKWTPNPDRYDIVFDGNGAESGGMKPMTNLAIGKAYPLTGNGFKKTGYHLLGWAVSPAGDVRFANKAKVTDLDLHGGEVTLYAVWGPNSYTLSFRGNGGTWVHIPEGKTKAVAAKSYTQPAAYDSTATLEENRFRRTGYTFAGWNTKANGTGAAYGGGETVLNLSAANGGKVTLYAQWQANQYTIVFDPGAGTGAMDAQPMVYGKSAKLAPHGFSKPGYRFTGWSYTNAAGQTKTFANRAEVKNLASGEGDTVVLTANWAVNTYHIRFSPNGGNGKTPAVIKNQKYGLTTRPLPENPFTRSGYDFAGWNTKKDGSGEVCTTTDIPVAKNKVTVTLYAIWAPRA